MKAFKYNLFMMSDFVKNDYTTLNNIKKENIKKENIISDMLNKMDNEINDPCFFFKYVYILQKSHIKYFDFIINNNK